MDRRRRLENDDETPVVGMESFTFAYKRAESGLICPHGYSHHWGVKLLENVFQIVVLVINQ